MGQGSSSVRETNSEGVGRREGHRNSFLARNRESWIPSTLQEERITDHLLPRNHTDPPVGSRTNLGAGISLSQPFTSLRRQISTQIAPHRTRSRESNQAMSNHDEISIEQEQRHLMAEDDSGIPFGPVTTISASPMPRQPSVMSRLGSRLLPRYTNTGSEGDSPEQRRVLRRRLSDSSPPRIPLARSNRHHHRLSMFGSLSPSSTSSSTSFSRRRIASISRPIPLTDEAAPPVVLASTTLQSADSVPSITMEEDGHPLPIELTPTRPSRFQRVRRSISSPLGALESIFGGNSLQASERHQNSPRRQVRGSADETDYLLPPLNVIDSLLDLEETTLRNREAADTSRSDSIPALSDAINRSPGWAQRWAERSPPTRREHRGGPSLLRGRSSRMIRRDDEAPLSRILQLAAAAIAAQLAGTAEGITDMEAVGDDNFDGNLNNFLETLNTATGVTAARNENQVSVSNLPPLNFWRVFRFVNSNTRLEGRVQTDRPPGPNPPVERQTSANVLPEGAHTDPRSMTLVLVGVRSVPSATLNRESATDGADQNAERLIQLPSEPQAARSNGSGGFLRHANGRSRFASRRRTSMGGVNPFPAQYESQRHQRVNSTAGSPGNTTPIASTIAPLLPESPPGPHPPPSTPADAYLSAQPSGTTTPTRRPSSAATMAQASTSLRQSVEQANHGALPEIPQADMSSDGHSSPTPLAVRQRRRSDSETARHRELGSGAARRNGIISTDEAPRETRLRSSRRNGIVEPDGASAAGGRSWLIYVVGTNLSQDHPAFATPSLFTDNPTYEDMIMLSSLLGPAKPPVASREDVATRLGVFLISWHINGNDLRAVALEGDDFLSITSTERCLVCLTEYEIGEEVRRLDKCSHVFHRECIDTWLTTGRNSCPLCRGAGVEEHGSPSIHPNSTNLAI